MSEMTAPAPAAPEGSFEVEWERPPRPARPRNVILIGFSFTGKSTIGRLLARRLRWRPVDTDREIRERTGLTPQQIFAQQGEAAFRAIEREVVRDVCRRRRQVIATGGGAPMDPENRAAMFDGNVVVLLDASPEAILGRLRNSMSGESRPLLESPDPLERIRSLKAERDRVYRQAHLVIETERLTAMESAELIYRLARLRG
jgi:shikimate kinase